MSENKNIEDWLQDISNNLEKANQKLDKLTGENLHEDTTKPDNTEDKYLTVKEVSALIGLSERTIYRRYYEGKLKSFKMGGLRVFPLSEVNKFIENEKQAEAEKKENSKSLLGKWFGK